LKFYLRIFEIDKKKGLELNFKCFVSYWISWVILLELNSSRNFVNNTFIVFNLIFVWIFVKRLLRYFFFKKKPELTSTLICFNLCQKHRSI
jgi:hypothetical protein